jgi:hypothetical protein
VREGTQPDLQDRLVHLVESGSQVAISHGSESSEEGGGDFIVSTLLPIEQQALGGDSGGVSRGQQLLVSLVGGIQSRGETRRSIDIVWCRCREQRAKQADGLLLFERRNSTPPALATTTPTRGPSIPLLLRLLLVEVRVGVRFLPIAFLLPSLCLGE